MKKIFIIIIIIINTNAQKNEKDFSVEVLSSQSGHSVFLNNNFITRTPCLINAKKDDIITIKIGDILINYVYDGTKKLNITTDRNFIFINKKKYIQIVKNNSIVEDDSLWGLVIQNQNVKINDEVARNIKELIICVEDFPQLSKFGKILFLSFGGIKNIDKNISYLKNVNIKYLDIRNSVASRKVINSILNFQNLESLNLANTSSFKELINWQYDENKLKLISKIKTIKFLSLSSNQINNNSLKFIGKMENLKNLDISFIGKITEKGISYLPKTIECLNLRGTGLSNAVLEVLSNFKNICYLDITSTKISKAITVLSKFPNIEMLLLNNIRLKKEVSKDMELPNLKYLSLYNCSNINHLLSIKLPKLKKINLSSSDVKDSDIKTLVKNSKYLETINLNNTKITNNTLKYLKDSLFLSKLYLLNTNINQSAFKYLANHKNLIFLSLGKESQSFLDYQKIIIDNNNFVFLYKLKKIKYLYLSDIEVRGNVFYYLKSLSLIEFFIVGANLKSLSGIEELKSLESLDISFNELKNNEKKYLRKLPNLSYLNVSGTDIDIHSLENDIPFLRKTF